MVAPEAPTVDRFKTFYLKFPIGWTFSEIQENLKEDIKYLRLVAHRGSLTDAVLQ